jgi:prepilin-type N-terminal cleavage/methylation domain-containing protein
MKSKYKGFTLIEITLVIVLISILLLITTPLVSSVVIRNDLGSSHESLYNALLRAQQLSKNQYKNSQWRVCIDNTAKTYTIAAGTCTATKYSETIKISSSINISSNQTLDIAFKPITGELDYTNNFIRLNLNGGEFSKSLLINKSGVIDKESLTDPVSDTIAPSIVNDGLVLHLDAGNIASYPVSGTIWTDLSGNNNHGTLAPAPSTPTYSSSNGGTLVFDGMNDYVNQSLPSLNLTNFVFSSWIKGSGVIFGSGVNENWSRYWLFQTNLFLFRPTQVIGDGINYTINIPNPTTNTYNMISYVRNGSTMYAFQNGILVSTYNNFPTNPLVTYSDWGQFIGKVKIDALPFTFEPFFNGAISQIYLYNRALTPEEIQQNFNATKGRFGL